MQELRCPHDDKKLAEVRDDYFDAPDEKDKYRNKGKLFILNSSPILYTTLSSIVIV